MVTQHLFRDNVKNAYPQLKGYKICPKGVSISSFLDKVSLSGIFYIY